MTNPASPLPRDAPAVAAPQVAAKLRALRRTPNPVDWSDVSPAPVRWLAILTGLALTGCAGPDARTSNASPRRPSPAASTAADEARAWEVRRPEANHAPAAAPTASAAVASDSPTALLPAYAVRETAFSDFGMSVKTNFDVQWGGHVAWMVVTAIDAGSSAAQRRLGVGDRILAIDGRQITTFDRDAMLAALFHRKTGETSRLLVLGPKEALPRFVMLVARRP